MHRLLKRQLKKAGLLNGKVDEESLEYLYLLINQAYIDADKDRHLQENILNTSSKEMQNLYENIRDSDEKDKLTGILNKQNFENKLTDLLQQSRSRLDGLAVCFFDIDHFKKINDTLGHDVGDLLLKNIAERLLSLLKPEDLFARMGGDEFIIVFDKIKGEKELLPKLEQLMKLFRNPWLIDQHELILSASVGITLFPNDDESAYGLMKKADLALYRAKSLGRDNYIFYTNNLNIINQEKMFLEQSMPAALQNKEFELYFQPIVNSQNNKILGAEALIRWNHPKRGLIFPGRFLNLAENTGFIIKLGTWIIEESCMAIARFSMLDETFKVSVNISIRQFEHDNLYNVIKAAIAKTGINPGQLAIEITENVMGVNIKDVINKIDKIKSLGIEIYLDDFGTGYSSLASLNKLNIDVIKIDKAFVDEIVENKMPMVLLNSIISLGLSLKKRVIAEGVEHTFQVDYLLENGCDIYQGYVFSKPVPEDNFSELLANSILETNFTF